MPTVNDILAAKGDEVVSVVAAESVLNAARLMNERGIGGVLVMEEGEVVGIFTERDVLRRVVAERRDPSTTTLREVMTAPVIRCRPDAKVVECRALMSQKRIRHMPVMCEDEVCGIITTGDILAHQVEEQQDTIEHLNRYVFDLR